MLLSCPKEIFMLKLLAKILAGFVLVVAVFIGAIFWKFSSNSTTQFTRPQFTIHEDVIKGDLELGKRIYMVRNGCIDCHGVDLAGAKVMDDPAMGSIYGANITPYGIKNWTDEEVAGTIRYGIHKEGRSLRFMPAFDFEGLSKTDIAALIAFIRSVPEVKKENHKNTFGPVARVLSSFGKMPVMFSAFAIDQTKGFGEKPPEEPTLAFGQYLANSCVGCHGAEYRGGTIPGGDPAWPAAANVRLGADTFWTEAKFRDMIATGISPKTGNALRAPMPVALLKQMNETEIKALWLFLQSQN